MPHKANPYSMAALESAYLWMVATDEHLAGRRWAIIRNHHPRHIRWGRSQTYSGSHRLYFVGPIVIARRIS